MFGLGMGEVLIILVLALILLGPQKLPDAAKQLGKGLREFRRATEDLKQQFETEFYSMDESAKASASKPKLVRGDAPAGASSGAAAPAQDAAAGAPVTPADAQVPFAAPSNIPGLEAVRLAAPEPPPAAAPAAPDVAAEPSPPRSESRSDR